MTDVTHRGDRAPVPADWTYAPAPESTDIVRLEDRYGLFVGGEWIAAKEHYTTVAPRDESPLAEVGQAGEAEVHAAVDAARDAFKSWSRIAPSQRAKYLFRIARILAERSREFAVLESLNGGKPIKESRDVDLPLAAAHFFYYAGWADKLEYAFPNRTPKPLGVCGQIIPWNFPLLMLVVEDRARARRREHRRPEAGGDDAADRAALLRRAAPGGSAAGRRQHRHGRRPHRRGARRRRRSTRSRSPARPRSARRSSGGSPAPARS